MVMCDSLVVDGVDPRQLALCKLQTVLLSVNENDLLGPTGLGTVGSQDPNCTNKTMVPELLV